MIQVSVGDPIKTAEGTTLVMDKVQANYGGKTPLKFLWTILSGPQESIRIQRPSDMQPRIIIGNLEAPTDWVLRLQVSDGKTENSADLKISAFPARLESVGRIEGAWIGAKRMGDKWVAVRGEDLEIFGSDLTSLAKLKLPRPVVQFFATSDSAGKGTIYIQTPEGNWSVLQSDPVSGFKKTDFPPLGKNIRRIVPFELEGTPYFFALLERSIDLWNLSDPLHPKLKTSLGGFLKNPLFLAFSQRNIYVAEEDSIHLIDFSTGNLVASIPSGGSITSLATYTIDGKNYLMASIGTDRTAQGRKDYGLRIFEIDASGKLGGEKRVTLGESTPIDRATLIPGADLALLSVPGPKGLSLKAVNLRLGKEVSLQGEAAQGFLAISEITTGLLSDHSVALVADGNQLKALSFKAQADGAYAVTLMKSLPGVLSAAWVKSNADASQLWVGDEGTQAGGALTLLNGQDFSVTASLNSPDGTYPAHADFRTGGDLNPLLFLSEDPGALKRGGPEGLLGLASSNPKDVAAIETSKNLVGAFSPQGQLRGSGIAGRNLETGLRIAVAIARISGNIGGAGVAILDKPSAQTSKVFLSGDLAKSLSLIALQDARDVAISADGKAAFVAAGSSGLIAIDLEKKTPVARMSLGTEEWIADRVLLGEQGDLAIVSFVNRATRKVLIKTFGIAANLQMQEYGSIAGLPAGNTVEGVRAPRPALTEDDLYLFVPVQTRVLGVFNLSNPADPVKIAEIEVDGEIRGVALGNRFKDIFLALGPSGVSKLSFGF